MFFWNFSLWTLVIMSLPLACVFHCLFTFALTYTSGWLVEIWQLSRQGATGELEVEFKFQRLSCKLSFLFLPLRDLAGRLAVGQFFPIPSNNSRTWPSLPLVSKVTNGYLVIQNTDQHGGLDVWLFSNTQQNA